MIRYVIDLDSTLAKYERVETKGEGLYRIGDPIPGSREFVKELSEHIGRDGQKAKILIFTRRLNEEEINEDEQIRVYKAIENWLNKHDFVWHEIYFKKGKPDGTAFIDDRGVQCRPQENPNAYKEAVEYIKSVIIR